MKKLNQTPGKKIVTHDYNNALLSVPDGYNRELLCYIILTTCIKYCLVLTTCIKIMQTAKTDSIRSLYHKMCWNRQNDTPFPIDNFNNTELCASFDTNSELKARKNMQYCMSVQAFNPPFKSKDSPFLTYF